MLSSIKSRVDSRPVRDGNVSGDRARPRALRESVEVDAAGRVLIGTLRGVSFTLSGRQRKKIRTRM